MQFNILSPLKLLSRNIFGGSSIQSRGVGVVANPLAFSPNLIAPNRIFQRQNQACNPLAGCGASSTLKCCGTVCIQSDYVCCPSSPAGTFWCQGSNFDCIPCPAGQNCVVEGTSGIQESAPWTCVSTGAAVSTPPSSSPSVSTPPSSDPSVSTPPSSSPPSSSPSISTPPSSDPSVATPPSSSPSSTTTSTSSSRTLTTTTVQAPPPPPPTTSTPQPKSTTPKIVSPPSQSSKVQVPTLVTIAQSPSSTSSGGSTTTTSSSTHSSVSRWHGRGPLLSGYCATPEYTIILGPQTAAAYYIPVIGCMGNKLDCCPFEVLGSSTTDTTTVTETATVTFGFPSAAESTSVTLPNCPDDYVTVSSVCCPSGYDLWNEALGGETPCYSTTSPYLTPPPIGEPTPNVSTTTVLVTSTVVNVVYAMNYPVVPPSGMKTGVKAGIGVGVGVGAIALAAAGIVLFRRWRERKDRKNYPSDPSSSTPVPEASSNY